MNLFQTIRLKKLFSAGWLEFISRVYFYKSLLKILLKTEQGKTTHAESKQELFVIHVLPREIWKRYSIYFMEN